MIQDEELRSLYQTTGTERLQKLQMGLLHLEQEPNNPVVLEELRREIHSLKGDSNSVGLAAIATLAQQIEAIIKAVQRQELAFTLTVSDRLYQGLHAAGQLLHEAVSGEPGDVDLEHMLNLLGVVLETATPAPIPLMPPSIIHPGTLYIEDDELREIYRTTSEGRLQTLVFSLQQLEQGADEDVLEVLRRETHSLKGDSRAVEVDAVAELTQAIEDIVKDIQRQSMPFTAEVSECLDHGLAVIHRLVHEAVSGEPSGVDVDQMLDHLMAVATAAIVSPPVLQPAVEQMTQPLTSTIDDAELREIYRATSEERLQQLEASLLHLEKNPHDDATLATLMREAHSLKGDSRSAGVDSVEALAHALEDVLTSLQRQELDLGSAVSDSLYQGLDAMGQLVREAVTGELANINTDQLLQALRANIPRSETSEAEVEPRPVETTPQALPALPRREEDVTQIETVRVQTRELDVLMAQAEELAVTRIQVAQTSTQTAQVITLWEEWKANQDKPQALDPAAPSYEEQLEALLLNLKSTIQENSSKLEVVAEDLRDRIRKLQLIPLSTLFQPLPRVVRDLSKQQSKQVDLILEGEDTTADKRLLQGIKDSLMHLVRNAIDHGIETPEEREAAGKPPTATLRVKAHQTAISLIVEITDDGRGLDTEQIKRTAIKRRLYGPEELDAMPASQIQRLILAPGFSTRSFITEISGRGVGLDVVRTQVEQLKGNIQIDSTPGQGCTFRLQLSTALSTTNVVLVETQGIPLALPIDFLQMTLLIAPEQIVTTDGQDTIDVDGQMVPVASLMDVLELSDSPIYDWVAKPQPAVGDRRPCILLKVGNDQAGFFVDQLIDQREVVSKALNPLLKRVRNVTGATILGTGDICMILNPPDLIKSLQRQPLSETLVPAKQTPLHQRVILLVEDSPPVRIQEKRLFEGAGYEVVIATNGLEGYNTLKTRKFDAVVSDVEMPHMDGLSLVAKIRQLPEYDDLPVILVTTLDSDADRKRGADAGANAYIIKGRFNQEALLGALERLT
ncbi:MAG: Hpt domain-containing protein [Leptolyngbya sp. SIO1E4]|nr:Hpt domain-containing protein [Leptolyngbya sp. SIO1E4]